MPAPGLVSCHVVCQSAIASLHSFPPLFGMARVCSCLHGPGRCAPAVCQRGRRSDVVGNGRKRKSPGACTVIPGTTQENVNALRGATEWIDARARRCPGAAIASIVGRSTTPRQRDDQSRSEAGSADTRISLSSFTCLGHTDLSLAQRGWANPKPRGSAEIFPGILPRKKSGKATSVHFRCQTAASKRNDSIAGNSIIIIIIIIIMPTPHWSVLLKLGGSHAVKDSDSFNSLASTSISSRILSPMKWNGAVCP